MLVFEAVKVGPENGTQNAVKKKVFKAAYINTIYRQFNDYCKKRGFTIEVLRNDSYGQVGWKNTNGEVMILRFVRKENKSRY